MCDGVSDRLLCSVQLFQALSLPAVRRSVFPVVSLMLLGFQQSLAAFLKVRTGDISHNSLIWNDFNLTADDCVNVVRIAYSFALCVTAPFC